MVRTHLEYAVSDWGAHDSTQMDQSEAEQEIATKMVPHIRGRSYPDRLQALDMPTFRHRKLRGNVITVYNILHGRYHKEVSKKLHKSMDVDREPLLVSTPPHHLQGGWPFIMRRWHFQELHDDL